jgi:hypothetical protein
VGRVRSFPGARLAALTAAVALGACGYGFSQRWVARGGAERVHVRTFENLSTEPELGAALTAALREELARRGADAGEGAPAAIEGDVRATEPVPTSPATAAARAGLIHTDLPPGTPVGAAQVGGGTWRVGLEVRARLVEGGAVVAQHAARVEADYVGGGDPLETEGRRAIALRRLAGDAARGVLRAFER